MLPLLFLSNQTPPAVKQKQGPFLCVLRILLNKWELGGQVLRSHR